MRDLDPIRLPIRYDARAGVRPAWDPAGARLAVVAHEGLVVLDVRAPEVRVLGATHARARSMAFSPGGDMLAVAYDDRDLQRLLRVESGEEIWSASVGEIAIDDVLWSPDGEYLAFVGEEVVVCDAGTGQTRWRRGETRPRQVVGAERLVESGQVRVVEHARVEEDRVFPSEAQWSPDSRYLAVSWGSEYRVLDARDGRVRGEGRYSAGVLRWTSWGNALYKDYECRLARCASHIVDRWAGTTVFSRDGRNAAAEGDRHCLWVQDLNRVRSLDGHPRTIKALAWSATGMLATACRDGVVRGLRRFDGELEEWARLDAEYGGLSWSPDGAHLAVCTADSVFVIDIDS